jgi:hypothetical protein
MVTHSTGRLAPLLANERIKRKQLQITNTPAYFAKGRNERRERFETIEFSPAQRLLTENHFTVRQFVNRHNV